jgi:signal transduction histidine kinase
MSTATILVIDDEVGMREGCRRALKPHGYQVSVAEHGAEALRILREMHVDLVLLDAMMPGISGLELLGKIHEHDADIVCVMITGYATVDLAARAMKEGAHAFLPKPFTSDELLSAVRQGLQDRQRQIEIRRQKEREEEVLALERTQQERAKFNAIESRFMLVVVHELRNPVGVVKNYLQLMRAGYVAADELDEYLDRLDQRATQLLDMLDELLELAHLKQGLDPSHLRPVSAASVVSSVAEKLRAQATAKGLAFQVKISHQPAIKMQSGHMESLWRHLVDNAIRYTPAGSIDVLLAEEDEQIVGKVIDTGIGISNEELGRIFQEFYRSENAKAQCELGTGLGLPIVEQIVRLYQGTIEVDSQLGRGSTFIVRLPKDAQSPAF